VYESRAERYEEGVRAVAAETRARSEGVART
jgi:hypothetical protein